MVSRLKKKKIVKEFGRNEKDTGSAQVQVAILTAEIEDLKTHFKENKKDNHSRRGFIAKIEKRKKLLSYLKNEDYSLYEKTIKKLGIRK